MKIAFVIGAVAAVAALVIFKGQLGFAKISAITWWYYPVAFGGGGVILAVLQRLIFGKKKMEQ